MNVIEPGHVYELECIGPSVHPEEMQHLQFYRGPKGSENEMTGTTNEEVLAMLIDRFEALYGTLPDAFTADALRHCISARAALEARTRDRENRGVEGTNQP